MCIFVLLLYKHIGRQTATRLQKQMSVEKNLEKIIDNKNVTSVIVELKVVKQSEEH